MCTSPSRSPGRRRVIVTLMVLSVVVPHRSAATPVTLDFSDVPIAEMFIALGRVGGASVVPDETVRGRASYYLAAATIEVAIAELAERFDLFVEERNGIYTISAVRVEVGTGELLTISAPRVPVPVLIDRISRATQTPILIADSALRDLSHREITYHSAGTPLSRVVSQIAAQLPNHRAVMIDGAYLLSEVNGHATRRPDNSSVTVNEGGYGLSTGPSTLSRMLALLFEAGDREYQLLKRTDPPLGGLELSERPFDALLRLVLEQADAVFTVLDGIYYITDAPPQSATAQTLTTEIIRLDHLPVGALLELLPNELIMDVTIRPDRSSNALTLTGHADGVARVQSLISRLDARPGDRTHHRIELHGAAPEVLALLPRHLSTLPISPIPGSSAITVFASPEQVSELELFLAAVDVPRNGTLMELSHLRIEQLLQHLPPSAHRNNILPTNDPHRFFYRGSEDSLSRFAEDLRLIDVAAPQIRYHLLVIQYQESDGSEFGLDLSSAPSSPSATQAFIGSIGRLLSLDFDIVATFGYQFAARLNAGLTASTTAVVADTTLSALSGESVSFRNTSTYRYRDTAFDPETGAQRPTGVIREITSGLIIEIQGRSHGDDVTMDVSATVSRRGADVSGTGNPPPTSEKLVRTQVRAASGEPVMLGGLRLREEEQTVDEPMLLGRIPLIGRLFQNRRSHDEATELAIYIIPRVERAKPNGTETGADLMDIYLRYYGDRR